MEADGQQQSSFYQRLPRAKTLCQRGEAKLVSLLRLGRLPLHVDSCLPSEETQAENPTTHPPNISKLHILPTTKLYELFAQPLYTSTSKILQTQCNETFGQLRCKLRDLTTEQILEEPYSQSTSSDDLHFESKFEGGNLAMVSRLSQNQYALLVQKDINTNSCTQWFCFRVRNFNRTGTFRFSLVNMTKKYSAYEDGMKVCNFSQVEYQRTARGWYRGCSNISYCRNSITRNTGSYFTLSFDYQFEHCGDEVYFANSYPYTYSRLQRYLDVVEEKHSKMLHRRRLGETLSGNHIEMVTITNFEEKDRVKPILFVTARVHPGETASSYVCEGLLNYLLGNTKQAEGLRNQFIFKIVPMMNPDGVVNGNYRCSLFSRDLNRRWRAPDKSLHPENFLIKKMIVDSYGDKLAYIDLHGHSKKRGVFMYGCRSNNNPYECRQLPFLMHKQSKVFNYYGCNFNMSRIKEGTGRVTVWRELKIAHSYTLECSFFGPAAKFRTNFVKLDYRQVGEDLGRVFYQYFYRNNTTNLHKNSEGSRLADSLKELYANSDLLAVGNCLSEGSSSAASLEEFEKQSKVEKLQLQPTASIKEMSTTFLPTRSPRDTSPTNNDYYRPRRFQQPERYAPFETARLGKNQFTVPKQTSFKIPSINELKMEAGHNGSFRPNYDSLKRHSDIASLSLVLESPRPDLAIREPSTYMANKFEMTSIIFPSALRNQYTNYQRYRRQEVDFNMLFSGEAGIVRNRQPREVKQFPINRRILERIKNKKEIRSVSRRPERRLQDKMMDML